MTPEDDLYDEYGNFKGSPLLDTAKDWKTHMRRAAQAAIVQPAVGVAELVTPMDTLAQNKGASTAPGIVGALGSLVDLGYTLTGNEAPETIRNLSESFGNHSQGLDDLFGLEPLNAGSLLMRNIVTGFAPMGAGIKVAANASRATKAAAGVANVATELLIPLRQSSNLVTVSAAQALPVAIMETLDHFNALPMYEGILPENPNEIRVASREEPQDANDKMLSYLNEYDDSIRSIPEFPLTLPEYIDLRERGMPFPMEDKRGNWYPAGAAVAAAGAALAGTAYFKAVGNKAKLRSQSQLSGSLPDTHYSDWRASLSKFTDAQGAVFEALRKEGVSEAHIDELKANVHLGVNPTAITGQIVEFMRSGAFPRLNRRTLPIGQLHQKLASLDGAKLGEYDDYLTAQNALYEMRRNGLVQLPNGADAASMRALVRQIENNSPEVVQLAKDTKQIYNDTWDWLHEMGVLGREQWQRGHKQWYVPTKYAFDPSNNKLGTWIDDFFGLPGMEDARDAVSHILKRENLVELGHGLHPHKAMESYLTQMVNYALHNQAKIKMLDAMLDPNNVSANSPLRGVVHAPSTHAMDNAITVRRNGKLLYYRIDDPAIRTAMKLLPETAMNSFVKIADGVRKVQQSIFTGKWNPLFVFRSWMYEIPTALANKPGHKAVGVLGELKEDLSILTAPINPVLQYQATVAAGRTVLQAALRASALENGTLSRLVGGPQQAIRIADEMMANYEKSMIGMFNKYGGGNASFVNELGHEDLKTVLDRTAPEFVKRMQQVSDSKWANVKGLTPTTIRYMSQAYEAFMTNQHAIIRQAFLNSRNKNIQRAKGISPIQGHNTGLAESDLIHIVGQARELGGDTSKRGGQGMFNAINRAVPYANTAYQVFSKYAGTFVHGGARERARMATAVGGMLTAGTAALMHQFSQNPELANKYWNEWTPEQRASTIPIFNEDGELIAEWSIEHMMRPIWAPYIEAVGSYFGWKQTADVMQQQFQDMTAQERAQVQEALMEKFGGNWYNTQDIRRGTKRGFADIAPDWAPNYMRMAAAGSGYDIPQWGRGQTVRENYSSVLDPTDSKRMENSLLHKDIDAVLQELGGMAFQSVMTEAAHFAQKMQSDSTFDSAKDATVDALANVFMSTQLHNQPVGPALFGIGLEKRVTGDSYSTNYVKDTKETLKVLAAIGTQLESDGSIVSGPVMGGGETAISRSAIPIKAELLQIVEAGKMLNEYLAENASLMKEVMQKEEEVRVSTEFNDNKQLQRKVLNEYARIKRRLTAESLQLITRVEDDIRQSTGFKEFSFRNFDPAPLLSKAPHQ